LEIVNGHVGDFALLLVALAYVVSLVRDWRPIRALRDENKDLRTAFTELQRKYDDLEKRYIAIEKSRDFQAAFEPLARAIDQARADSSHEHERRLTAFSALEERSEQAWTEITRGLAANTSALGALAAGINAGTVPDRRV
jgi:biopolymer transport protein ExbB/TolQ